jgi:hypothetical protein
VRMGVRVRVRMGVRARVEMILVVSEIWSKN